MEQTQPCGRGLSGNALKILAGISMVIDHTGLILFPNILAFRIVGRLAFPIFAFMIAQGCQYTHNRLRYFFTVLLTALPCQAVFTLATGSSHLSVLVTFSVSIFLICLYQSVQESRNAGKRVGFSLLLAGCIAGLWCFTRVWSMDYGFWGCLLPLFAALPLRRGIRQAPQASVWAMLVGLLPLCAHYGGVQYVSLLTVPLLLTYSGRRGKWRMKYFFYILYPAHLVLLQIIALLMG